MILTGDKGRLSSRGDSLNSSKVACPFAINARFNIDLQKIVITKTCHDHKHGTPHSTLEPIKRKIERLSGEEYSEFMTWIRSENSRRKANENQPVPCDQVMDQPTQECEDEPTQECGQATEEPTRECEQVTEQRTCGQATEEPTRACEQVTEE